MEITINVNNVKHFMYVQAKILEKNKQTDSFNSSTNIGLFLCYNFSNLHVGFPFLVLPFSIASKHQYTSTLVLLEAVSLVLTWVG